MSVPCWEADVLGDEPGWDRALNCSTASDLMFLGKLAHGENCNVWCKDQAARFNLGQDWHLLDMRGSL